MNQANGDDGNPVELFQIIKDDDIKVLNSICQQILKTQQWPQGLEKVSFHSNPKERQHQRCSKYCTIALISHGTWSHHFIENRCGDSGNSVRLYFWGAPKSLQMVIAAMKLKDPYSLDGK